MTYENAPATRMLATHCAACGRPLVDAKSVEAGLGPDCRKRHGYSAHIAGLSEGARAEANRAIYQIALDQAGPAVAPALERLRTLGFTVLVDRVLERLDGIRIQQTTDNPLTLDVRAPYNEAATADWRRLGRWDGDRKCRVVAHVKSLDLMALLRRHYPGCTAIGRKGIFTVPSNPTPVRSEGLDLYTPAEKARMDRYIDAAGDAPVDERAALRAWKRPALLARSPQSSRWPASRLGPGHAHRHHIAT